jgi:hypothetical protein
MKGSWVSPSSLCSPHLSLALSVNGEGTGEVREGMGVRVEKASRDLRAGGLFY